MWRNYGFPDITFLPSGIPAVGLWSALAERDFSGKIIIPAILESTDGHLASADFDRHLWRIAGNFVDHLKLDLTDLASVPRWTQTRLCEELNEVLIDPQQERLRPEFCAAWALQRFRIINLLKFAQIDYLGVVLSGAEHSGIPTSPQAAIDAALANMQSQKEIVNVAVQRTTTTIWGPDHGWKDDSYCADVYQVGELQAVLPAALKDTEVRLYLQVDAPGAEEDQFDSYGTGLYRGLQILIANQEGYFLPRWSLPAQPDKVRVPTEGKSCSFGFVCTQVFCCADFSKSFSFNEEFL